MTEDASRRTVAVPAEVMVRVLKVQQEMATQTGFTPSVAQIVRHLIDLGLAARTSHNLAGVS